MSQEHNVSDEIVGMDRVLCKFEPLKNIEYFKKVKVDEEIETICWENGADFSPEYLYEIGN